MIAPVRYAAWKALAALPLTPATTVVRMAMFSAIVDCRWLL